MTKVFGIINLTPDSSSGDGTYDTVILYDKISKYAQKGYYGVDIGGMSTAPNAKYITEEEELSRIRDIIPDLISFAHKLNLKVSLDSFRAGVIKFGLEHDIDCINDVTGFNNNEMINLAIKYPKTLCVAMHSLSAPSDPKLIIDKNVDIVDFIIKWANNKVNELINYGIARERIIIDIGLGFGKDAEQCWQLIDNFDTLKQHIIAPLYIGHSRKRFLSLRNQTESIEQKDFATNLITKILIDKKCDFLRLHT